MLCTVTKLGDPLEMQATRPDGSAGTYRVAKSDAQACLKRSWELAELQQLEDWEVALFGAAEGLDDAPGDELREALVAKLATNPFRFDEVSGAFVTREEWEAEGHDVPFALLPQYGVSAQSFLELAKEVGANYPSGSVAGRYERVAAKIEFRRDGNIFSQAYDHFTAFNDHLFLKRWDRTSVKFAFAGEAGDDWSGLKKEVALLLSMHMRVPCACASLDVPAGGILHFAGGEPDAPGGLTGVWRLSGEHALWQTGGEDADAADGWRSGRLVTPPRLNPEQIAKMEFLGKLLARVYLVDELADQLRLPFRLDPRIYAALANGVAMPEYDPAPTRAEELAKGAAARYARDELLPECEAVVDLLGTRKSQFLGPYGRQTEEPVVLTEGMVIPLWSNEDMWDEDLGLDFELIPWGELAAHPPPAEWFGQEGCERPAADSQCRTDVLALMERVRRREPSVYAVALPAELTEDACFEAFQHFLHTQNPEVCPAPCAPHADEPGICAPPGTQPEDPLGFANARKGLRAKCGQFWRRTWAEPMEALRSGFRAVLPESAEGARRARLTDMLSPGQGVGGRSLRHLLEAPAGKLDVDDLISCMRDGASNCKVVRHRADTSVAQVLEKFEAAFKRVSEKENDPNDDTLWKIIGFWTGFPSLPPGGARDVYSSGHGMEIRVFGDSAQKRTECKLISLTSHTCFNQFDIWEGCFKVETEQFADALIELKDHSIGFGVA